MEGSYLYLYGDIFCEVDIDAKIILCTLYFQSKIFSPSPASVGNRILDRRLVVVVGVVILGMVHVRRGHHHWGHYRNLSLSDRVIEGLDTVLLLGGMVTGYNRNGLFSATI